METKRPYYPKKWQWAEARTEELRRQFRERNASRYASYQRSSIRRKGESLDHLSAEITRMAQLTERLKAANV